MNDIIRVYCIEKVKVGQGIIGWGLKSKDLIKTTPVIKLEACPGIGIVAHTQEGGRYNIVNQ